MAIFKLLYIVISLHFIIANPIGEDDPNDLVIREARKICGRHPILNYPKIGLKQNRSLIFYNETSIESRILQDLTLVCNATYPLEWVFSTSLGNDWQIMEIRYMEKQFSRYSAELSYKPSKSQFKPLEIVCRSVEDKTCLQTTVDIKRNNFKGNQSLNIKITHSSGKNLVQYMRPEGTNVGCNILLQYSEKEKAFLCFSKTEKNLTLNFAENIDEETCYDKFSCGTFYTENKCEFKHWRSVTDLETTEKLYLSSAIENSWAPGVVICKPEGRPDNVSAAMHYFFGLPNSCEEFINPTAESVKIHRNNPPEVLNPSEFLMLCPPLKPLRRGYYRTDIIEISCISSLYYFADGLRIEIATSDGRSWSIPAPKPVIFKQQSYRNYTFEVNINDSIIHSVNCMAPIRKSNLWHTERYEIGFILEPNDIMFEGGSATTAIKYSSGTILRCKARGNPSPILKWTIADSETRIHKSSLPSELTPKEYDSSDGYRISEIAIPNTNPEKYYGIYNCEAENILKKKYKSFVLQEGDASLWYVWGLIIPLAVVIVGVFVGLLIWKIIKQQRKLRLLTAAELDEFMNGRPDIINSERSSSAYDVNSYATFLPYNKNYEILKDQLEIDANGILGSGAYGMVLRGVLTLRSGEKVKAAIKTVKPMDDISYFKALMSELKIMGFIGKHDNIVNLLGAFTKNIQNREIFIALEFCDNGSLLTYLKAHRHEFINYVFNGAMKDINVNRSSLSLNTPMSTVTLVVWARQVANGMDFLYHKKVIHGDLAARNILLSQNMTAKIGDFGLSRQLFEYANYIKKQQSPLPWKWLALECLQDMQFSSKSDVWAFGISLWEILTLGQVPFAGMRYNDEFLETLLEGTRPPRPQYSTQEIYDLMKQCWSAEPNDRPTFVQIKIFFDQIIQKIIPEEYLDLIDEPFRQKELVPRIDIQECENSSVAPETSETCQIVPQRENSKKKSFIRTAIFKKHLTYT